jgi:hypothetical protein
MVMGMAEILQKVSRSEKSICPKCFHNHVCLAIDNQPCFECNQFVEVVRCKDCKYAENMFPIENGSGHLMGDCTVRKEDEIVVMVWGNDFCSYGERKDNEQQK